MNVRRVLLVDGERSPRSNKSVSDWHLRVRTVYGVVGRLAKADGGVVGVPVTG